MAQSRHFAKLCGRISHLIMGIFSDGGKDGCHSEVVNISKCLTSPRAAGSSWWPQGRVPVFLAF